MRELETRPLEQSIANVSQKIRLLHAAQSELNIRMKVARSQTPSTMRKAWNDVHFHERILGGVLEELVEEANKLLKEIEPGLSSVQRIARAD